MITREVPCVGACWACAMRSGEPGWRGGGVSMVQKCWGHCILTERVGAVGAGCYTPTLQTAPRAKRHLLTCLPAAAAHAHNRPACCRGAHTFFLRQGEVARWGGYTVNLIHYEDAAGLCLAVLQVSC